MVEVMVLIKMTGFFLHGGGRGDVGGRGGTNGCGGGGGSGDVVGGWFWLVKQH